MTNLTKGLILSICIFLFFTSASGFRRRDVVTELVMLPVTVTDQHHRSIKDLQVTDFSVLDEGLPQRIVYFSQGDAPLSYALVIDSSGSMRKLIPDLNLVSKKLIDSNRPEDEMCLIRFSTGDDIQLVQDWTSDKKVVTDAIQNFQFRGGSSILDGLTSAVGYVKKHKDSDTKLQRRHVVVIITDGLEKDSFAKREEVLKHFRELGTQVYAIGLISRLDRQDSIFHKSESDVSTRTMRDIAAATGGFAFFPVKSLELPESTDALIELLHWRYMIAYPLPETAKKNTFHKVQVSVSALSAKGKYTVTTLPGYVN